MGCQSAYADDLFNVGGGSLFKKPLFSGDSLFNNNESQKSGSSAADTARRTEAELHEMHALSGSYEALFSKKAVLYKTLDLKNKTLTEADYKKYILEHYTFLSRPVFILNNKIYCGNTQQNMLLVMRALNGAD